jgi:glycosyltransferase involved in cell wall biosynthesis
MTQQPVLLAVGRPDPYEDHATLHEAFALLTDRFPDWRAAIVDDANGILVAGGDDRGARARAFSVVLARPMKDQSLRARLGAAGRTSVARFDSECVIDQWEALLLNVATKG